MPSIEHRKSKIDNPFLPLLAFVLLAGFALAAQARDLHVDPEAGDDRHDGVAAPVRTIGRAIRLAEPGDVIHLRPVVYRDYAGFYGKHGEPGKPIILDGHGATLEGSDPIDPAAWEETAPGRFRHDNLLRLDAAILGRWFFLWDGRMNLMGRTSKGPKSPFKDPDDLQPGEWTFVEDPARKLPDSQQTFGSFYLQLPPGQKLADARIAAPMRSAGVQFGGQNSHLVIRNLTATHPYNDGFNIHGSCRNVRFENIRAIECGDDGISSHDDCQYHVSGLVSIGNSTGICDTGDSVTSYERVYVRDCLAYDLFFLDSGRYSLKDVLVESSAVRAFDVTGREQQIRPCTIDLENVHLRRVKHDGDPRRPSEVRIARNSRFTARRCTFENLNIRVAGGEAEFRQCQIEGQLGEGQPPELAIAQGGVWRGAGNRYRLGRIVLEGTPFAREQFAEFQRRLAMPPSPGSAARSSSDADSHWLAHDEEAPESAAGADRAQLEQLRESK